MTEPGPREGSFRIPQSDIRNPRSIQNARARGSVLILVLALLVMLALMGTAYIAVARLDSRALNDNAVGGAVTDGGYNFGPVDKARADNLLNTVTNQVFDELINDLFDVTSNTAAGRAEYRRVVTGGNYKPYDFYQNESGPDTTTDFLLASRLPERVIPVPALPASTSYWPVLSFLPRVVGISYYSSPGAGTGLIDNTIPRVSDTTLPLVPNALIRPTSVTINPSPGQAPNDPNNRARVYPALSFGGAVRIAGDTDGDGIADAGLVAMDLNGDDLLTNADRVSDVNGTRITYYYAVRVVDNAAAINVNTAFSRAGDFTPGSGGATPVLTGPLYGSDLPNYGFFRSNIGLIEMLLPGTIATPLIAGSPNDLTRLLGYRFGNSTNASDLPFGRTDFRYISLGDTLEMNVARRPRKPGSNDGVNFKAFDIPSTAGALKYHGTLLDPDATRVQLENQLVNATRNTVSNYATDTEKMFRYYPADRFNEWFRYNLNYDPTSTNAVNHQDPDGNPLNIRALLTGTSAVTNHVPAMNMTGLAVDVKSTTPTTDASPVRTMTDWADPSTVGNANALTGKVGANTARFEDLWRAYWQVMADPNAPANPQDGGARAFSADSISRDSLNITSQEMLMLRSAIAAANTEDLRDADDDVTFRQVPLSATKDAVVYGTEKQPFISFAQIDGTGQVTLRLYNPYLTPATRNFSYLRLVEVTRSAGVLTMVDITTDPAVSGFNTSIGADAESGVIQITTGRPLVGKELMLMRSLSATPSTPAEFDPLNMVPLDVIDLQGLTPADIGTGYQFQRNFGWEVVYPGEYSIANPTVAGARAPRHDAMRAAAQPIDQRTIQLNNVGWPGPFSAGGVVVFPFNGFARDGDLLQIPFIGAYRIQDTAGQIIEMNPVTMDAEFARETTTEALEQIGRFCGDLAATEWASDLFDQLTTTQNPRDDHLPNINANAYPGPAPTPVSNEGGSANVAEDAVPTEGRININTAPRGVLMMLPWAVNPTTGQFDEAGTGTIVDAIVAARNTAPFSGLFDLNSRVPAFATMNGLITFAYNPTPALGDLTPAPAFYPALDPTDPDDGVAGDFESRYVQLTRLSNLITTRSDSFTVYVLVQGWRDADSATDARLVIEKRASYVVDRSGIRAGKATRDDLRVDGK